VELLLLRRRDTWTWEALVGGKGLRVGKLVFVEIGNAKSATENHSKKTKAEIVEILDGSERLIRFSEPIEPYFPKVGHVPLPPYIHEEVERPGTLPDGLCQRAWLCRRAHCRTPLHAALVGGVAGQGCEIAYVTLHVGLDTFAPVTRRILKNTKSTPSGANCRRRPQT
jgi:S-adenosylmethionine:tRNA ribosyltransferase-isomerase